VHFLDTSKCGVDQDDKTIPVSAQDKSLSSSTQIEEKKGRKITECFNVNHNQICREIHATILVIMKETNLKG
jgi:hypothetical protein